MNVSFITGVITDRTNLELVNTIGSKYGLTFAELSNEHVTKQLQPNQRYIWKNSKYCDCGTSLGATDFIEKNKKSNEKDLKQLKKKGWSETKINNWLENKIRSELKDERAAKHNQGNYEHDAENWINFLTELSRTCEIGNFGILFHWYSGGVETERIELCAWEQLNIAKLSTNFIFNMKADTVYELIGKGA